MIFNLYLLALIVCVLLIRIATGIRVTGLYRHACKGLSPDELSQCILRQAGDTFPDDRRFALLQMKNEAKFRPESPEWLHKENFLCAFTAPKLMATFQTCYEIRGAREHETYATPCDTLLLGETTEAASPTQRLLTVRDRASNEICMGGPVDLSTSTGRDTLGRFFSHVSGTPVVCVSSATNHGTHRHQFGNTSSGVKERNDTRTIHIVNKETVKALSRAIGGTHINPTRFRPNIVIEGLEPWEEFDWVGKQISIGSDVKMSVIKQTVRCDGVSVDPLDPDNVLDIPALLVKHFPTYGPFFGVYAVVDGPGMIALGDSIALC